MILECVTASRIQLLRSGHPSSSLAFKMRYYPSVPCGFTSDQPFFYYSFFPLTIIRERFHLVILSFLFFLPDCHSGLGPTETASLVEVARSSMRPVMLSGSRDYLASMVCPVQTPKVLFDRGTEGATLLVFYALLSWTNHQQHNG